MWPYDAVLDRKSIPWTVHLLSEWWLSCNYRRKAEWAVQYVTSVTGRDISLANAAKAVALVAASAASAAASADAVDHVEAAFSDAVVSLHPFCSSHKSTLWLNWSQPTDWLMLGLGKARLSHGAVSLLLLPLMSFHNNKKKNRIQIDLA